MKNVLILLIFSPLLFSCSDDDLSPAELLAAEVEQIDQFLAAEGIDAVEDPTGLRYVIHTQGTGESPIITDQITVNFEGRLFDGGSVFDAADGVAFPLNALILGWQIGVPNIQEGGSMTLYIPSSLGFGPRGVSPDIPPNAITVFDVDLILVQ